MAVEEVLKQLKTRPDGLSEAEAASKLPVYGKNELAQGKRKTLASMFLEQFKSVMVIILLIAAMISGFLGDVTDSVLIFLIVILNAVLGVVQENKAEKALAALKQMSRPYAKVKRDGEVKQIRSEDIVPGDIVIIESGDYVPADMRLIQAANLKIEEAALTGESVPVEKSADAIDKRDIVIGDMKNMAFLGTSVTYGRGEGIVTNTGMNTQVGKIADYLSKEDDKKTPLQRKLAEMGKYLSIAVIITAAVIFAAGALQGRPYLEMFLTSVSLAVAAIPEGLPAVVTIVLAMGVQKMAKRNAIVRKLPAVETLGGTEIICSDKTGTLTQNKMTAKELFFNGKMYSVEENELLSAPGFAALMQIMTLCNDSKVTKDSKGETSFMGDPTETALVALAAKYGFYKNEIERANPRRNEIPFESDRKLMTTINEIDGKYRALTKGAPDILVERCNRILINGNIEDISEASASYIRKAYSGMAEKALRVLALAYKDMDSLPAGTSLSSGDIEKDMVFAGLVGMIDPPRDEAKEAVRICKEAGIRPVMITGDHRDTAMAIARELGMIQDESEAITGSELDRINEEEFHSSVSKYSVYARVSPEHKVRIVKAWKACGKVVAMTGDGINDAPALKMADIGVGMGITGTDVAKGVSDIVLLDDNFATIVTAVEEGRKIYSNIRKTIQFLLSANVGEVIALFISTMLNWTILFPIQILWINLVTDALPALALGAEKAEQDIMRQKPRKLNSSVFSGGVGMNIIYQGMLEALIALAAYYFSLKSYSRDIAITVAFATLGLIQLAHSFNVRSIKNSLFRTGPFTNRYLVGGVAISALFQVIVILVPFLNRVFKVTPLNLEQWLIVIISSGIIIPIVELVKFAQNRING